MTKILDEKTAREEWMARAKDMTLADLPAFLNELANDYEHDYGTICVAIGAAAVAAAWALERTPQGGITGFQAGAITWEFIRGWNSMMVGDIGTRLQKFDDLLFPQYVEKFTSIDRDVWERLQKAAQEKIADIKEDMPPHPEVVAHWRSIARGNLPTGISVSN